LYPISKEKNIKIIFDKKMDYMREIDEEKMIRVFINILGNALRYAKEEIVIEMSELDNKVQIQIIDDGEGIDERVLGKEFDRFAKGEKGSSGLGLSITKTIIKAHKGRIEIYNSKTKGAIVNILL